MIRAGLRRLLVAFALAIGVTGVGSLAIGLLLGSAVQRSLSVGYMLAGSFAMMVGLVVGLRGFGRPSEQGDSGAGGERIASSAILIGIGIALVGLGIGLDPRSDIV